ncbi:MAG: hypothetical protein HY286_17655 [Planctomycetes bacterium]|nr:hypothetical protein [Planctomycetota bacterium]
MADLSSIKRIVIVMLENRSYDHILGALSLPDHGGRVELEGLQYPLVDDRYLNTFGGQEFYPKPGVDSHLTGDLPHERPFVKTQMAWDKYANPFSMSGFVEAYANNTNNKLRSNPPETMRFLTPDQVPVYSFLAENFTVCDHWFTPLPASTHPNRMVLLTGDYIVEMSAGSLVHPVDDHIFKWMDGNNNKGRQISYCVYHSGLSFLASMLLFDLPFGDDWMRSVDRIEQDFSDANNPPAQVVFVEPHYHAGFIIPGVPNDHHPPYRVRRGEEFVAKTYNAIFSGPYANETLMIVTNDEHGGFYDHVSPPLILQKQYKDQMPAFESAGPRVPAFLISPLLQPRSVFNNTLDHTSILQLIAHRFLGDPADYSQNVTHRRASGISDLADALQFAPNPRPFVQIQIPPDAITPAERTAMPEPTSHTELFRTAARRLLQNDPVSARKTFPDIDTIAK